MRKCVTWPVHPAQRGLLENARREGDGANCAFAYRISGRLDADRLAAAYRCSVDRYDALRLELDRTDAQPGWTIGASARVTIACHDARGQQHLTSWLQRRAGVRFDVARGPLGTIDILRTGDADWTVLEVFDHVIADGHAVALLHERVAAEYGGTTASTASTAVDASYTTLLDTMSDARDRARAAAFWHDWYRDFEPAPSAPRGSDGEAERELRLDPALRAAVERAAGRRGATLAAALLAAHAHAIARHAGHGDLAVFLAVDSRDADTRDIFGQATHVLPVRVHHQWSMSVEAHVSRVARQLLAMRDHLQVDVETLDECGAPMALAAPTATAFIFHDNRGTPPQFARLAVERIPLPHLHQAGGLVTVGGRDAAGDVTLQIRTPAGSAYHAQLEGVVATIESFLRVLVANPTCRLGDDAVLPNPMVQLIQRIAEPEAPYPFAPVDRPILRRLKRSDRVVMSDDGHAYTATALRTAVARTLARLRRLPVRRAQLVLVEEASTFERIASFLAVLRLGAVYVPIDAAAPATLRDDIVSRCRAGDGGGGRPAAEGPREGPRAPADPAYVIFTSGTTGTPKGVTVSHGALSNLAHGEGDRFGIRPGSRVLLIAPATVDPWICHVTGGLLAGATLVAAAARLTTSSLGDVLEREGVTHAFLPAPLFAHLETRPYRQLEVIATAGDQCRPEDVRRLLGPRRVFNIYGPTEATVTATIAELAEVTTPVPIGTPIRGVGARIVTDGLASVPPGCPGELMLTGAGLAIGYLNDAAATAERFRPDPFRALDRMYATGDRAYLDMRGQLYVIGRLDRQVKIRGFRVELGHLEAAARATGLCADAHAAAMTNAAADAVDGADKQLVLYVEGCERPVDLLAQLRTHLPAYLLPQTIEPLERLPRSPSGKIDASRLPAPRMPGTTPEHEVSLSPLALAWQSALGVRPRSSDDFFERGGDSLSVLRFVRAARQAGCSLAPQDVYEHSVFADLAARLEPESHGPAMPKEASARTPLGPSQRWFVDLDLPEPRRWNQQHVIWFTRLPHHASLERACAALLAATPILRSRIDGEACWCEPSNIDTPQTMQLLALDAPISDATLSATLESLHASLDPAHGRVIAGAVLCASDRRGALMLAAHHLVVDDWSWTVIEDRLRRILNGDAVAQDDGFARYARTIRQQLEAGAYALDAQAWNALLGSGRTAEANRRPTATARISADLHGDPRAHATRWGVPLAPLFLACVAHALAQFEPSGATIVDLERNGRTALAAVDLSQAVGWVALHHPMRLPHIAISRESVTQLAESLSAVPDMGVGYGALRWIGRAIDDRRVGRFAVNIAEAAAYHGDDGAQADLAAQVRRCGVPSAGIHNHLPHDAACVFRSHGGTWRVELTFDPDRLPHARATALLEAIVGAPDAPAAEAPAAAIIDPFAAPIPASAMQQLMLIAAGSGPGIYRPREVIVFDGVAGDHDVDAVLTALASGLGRLDPFRRRFHRTVDGIVQVRGPVAPLAIRRRRGGAAAALAWMRGPDVLNADAVLDGGAVVDVTAFEAEGEPLCVALQVHHAVMDGHGHTQLLAWLDDLLAAHLGGTEHSGRRGRITSLPSSSSETALRKHVAVELACASLARTTTSSPAATIRTANPRAANAPAREDAIVTAAEVARVSDWAQRHRVDVRAVFGGMVLAVAFNEARGDPVYLVTNGRDSDMPETLDALGLFWYFQSMRPDTSDLAALAARVFQSAGAALRDLRADAHQWPEWLDGRGTSFNFVRHATHHQRHRRAGDVGVRVIAQDDLFHFDEQIEIAVHADGSARVSRIAWPDRLPQTARLGDYLAMLRASIGWET